MAFKDLFPAEEEALIQGHKGKWFVRTMDGSGVLVADGSYAIVAVSAAGAHDIYFDKEVQAVVGAWNYYHHHHENFPDDQRHRWNRLYHQVQNHVSTVDDFDDTFNNVIQSEPMDF